MALIQECCKIFVVSFLTFGPLDWAEGEGQSMNFWTASFSVRIMLTYLN